MSFLNITHNQNVAWQGDGPTSLATELVSSGIIKEGTHVLDLGCGFGRNSNFFAQRGAIVDAINIDEKELKRARENAQRLSVQVNYIHQDASSLPFGDNIFDVILDAGCTHMCDRKTQDSNVIESARVIKSGGYLQYFGFSKEHPAYTRKPDSPMFRNLEDVTQQYGEYFDIISVKRNEWNTLPEENSQDSMHIGLQILMRRK